MTPNLDPYRILQQAVLACNLPAECRILVAVSGGPDSVALLHTLMRLAGTERPGWRLRAGHVNHGLRGAESDGDEEFVRRLCNELRVPLHVDRANVQQEASARHIGVEAAGRALRYRALERMLDEWPGDVIMTAHTADDQAETLVMRLLRGAGTAGLGSIRSRRDRIIRPWLAVRRRMVLDCLDLHGWEYRVDDTNADEAYTRNRLRAHVLPALEQEASGAIEAMARTALVLQSEDLYLSAEAREIGNRLGVMSSQTEITGSASLLRRLHPGLAGYVLRSYAQDLAPEIGFDYRATSEALRMFHEAVAHPRTMMLPGGITLTVAGMDFTMRVGATEAPIRLGLGQCPIPGSVEMDVGAFHAEILGSIEGSDVERLLAVCGPYHALCDAEQLGSTLAVRGRKPGDRIRPLGMDGSRKLQDIFVDRHIPREQRDLIPLVTKEDQPIWIPGFVLDRTVAVSQQSERVVHLWFVPNSARYHGRMPRRSWP